MTEPRIPGSCELNSPLLTPIELASPILCQNPCGCPSPERPEGDTAPYNQEVWAALSSVQFTPLSLFAEDPVAPTVITQHLDRDINLLTVSNGNVENKERADAALTQTRKLLTELAESTNPENSRNILSEISEQLGILVECGKKLQQTHTRRGFNEYNTLERAMDDLYAKARQQKNGEIHLEATLLGFNLANVNKHDASYRTGSVTIFLMASFAEQRATALGGKYYGVWGASSNTSISLGGLSPAQAELVRNQVAQDIVQFYQYQRHFTRPKQQALTSDERFAEKLLNHLGVESLSTSDLAGREYIKSNGTEALGMTAGHAFIDVQAEDLLRNKTADLNALLLLNLSSDQEKAAKTAANHVAVQHEAKSSADTTRPIMSAEVGLPLIAADGTDLTLTPAPTLIPHDASTDGLDNYEPKPIAGRMPRPEHDGKHALLAAEQAQALVHQMMSRDNTSPTAAVEIREALDQPFSGQNLTSEEIFEQTFEMSVKQHRFPNVFRLDTFAEMVKHRFGNDDCYMVLAEYKDYWGHNQEHRSGLDDRIHTYTLDVLGRGYSYKGIEVMVGTQGGDEVYIAFKSTKKDGSKLEAHDIAFLTNYVAHHFERLFRQYKHHQSVKVPDLPGGSFEGRKYALQEISNQPGKYHVLYEGLALSSEHIPELFMHIQEGHGIIAEKIIGPVRHIESLSEVAQVERWRVYEKVNMDGRKITIHLPQGQAAPEGYRPKEISLVTTLSPAVKIRKGSSAELIRHVIDKVGALADSMKALNRTIPDMNPQGDIPAVVDMDVVERLQQTQAGRAALNATTLVGSDLLATLATDPEQLMSIEYYLQAAMSYPEMLLASGLSEQSAKQLLVALETVKNYQRSAQGMLHALKAAHTGAAESIGSASHLTGASGRFVRSSSMLGTLVIMDMLANGGWNSESQFISGTSFAAGMGTRWLTFQGAALVQDVRAARVALTGEMIEAGKLSRSAAVLRAANALSPMEALQTLSKIKNIAALPFKVTFVSAVIEAVAMKIASDKLAVWMSDESRRSAIAKNRELIADAMEKMDFYAMKKTLRNEDGSVNPQMLAKYMSSARQMREALKELIIPSYLETLSEGEELRKAEFELAKSEADLFEKIAHCPDVDYDKYQKHEITREQLFENVKQRAASNTEWIRQLARAGGLYGNGAYFPAIEASRALESYEQEDAEIAVLRKAFQQTVVAKLSSPNEVSYHMPFIADTSALRDGKLNRWKDDYRNAVVSLYVEKLPSDPRDLIAMTQSFWESRKSFLDQEEL